MVTYRAASGATSRAKSVGAKGDCSRLVAWKPCAAAIRRFPARIVPERKEMYSQLPFSLWRQMESPRPTIGRMAAPVGQAALLAVVDQRNNATGPVSAGTAQVSAAACPQRRHRAGAWRPVLQ